MNASKAIGSTIPDFSIFMGDINCINHQHMGGFLLSYSHSMGGLLVFYSHYTSFHDIFMGTSWEHLDQPSNAVASPTVLKDKAPCRRLLVVPASFVARDLENQRSWRGLLGVGWVYMVAS